MDTSDLSHHILSRYNAELEGVRAGVLQMGGMVEQQLQNGVKALYEGDSRLGEQVAGLDHKVNAMEVSIDEDCSRILATRNPTASDLRLIVAVIKTITDLERIGDHAQNICEYVIYMALGKDIRHLSMEDVEQQLAAARAAREAAGTGTRA